MLKSADIKAIAKQVALEMYSLNDEVLSLSDVAIKLSKSEAAIKQMCYEKFRVVQDREIMSDFVRQLKI